MTALCHCGHTRDDHWYDGFLCVECGCPEYRRLEKPDTHHAIEKK